MGVWVARRILTAKAESFCPFPPLQVDDRVEIQWLPQVRYVEPGWSDEITSSPPSYKVTRFGKPFSFLNYGTLIDDEDIEWLKSVLDRKDQTKPPENLARVHEVQMSEKKEPVFFKIEVLTGKDAESLLRAMKAAALFEFLKENWWQVGIGLIVAYWWFF